MREWPVESGDAGGAVEAGLLYVAYDTDDLAPGRKIIFAATGVTDGALMRGVRFFGSGKRTHSLVMTSESKHIRFVDTMHIEGGPDTVIRF